MLKSFGASFWLAQAGEESGREMKENYG